MNLLAVVITLIVVGVLLYLAGLIPMDPTILRVIQVVVLIAVVLWLLNVFGVLNMAATVPLPRVR